MCATGATELAALAQLYQPGCPLLPVANAVAELRRATAETIRRRI
jgi:hypothetical protein